LGKGKAIHLNQKPIDLTRRILEASTNEGDVVWEPFGGLFTTALVARRIKRKAFAGEMDGTYFQYGVRRFEETVKAQGRLFPIDGEDTIPCMCTD
jgi:DNA modification methylase